MKILPKSGRAFMGWRMGDDKKETKETPCWQKVLAVLILIGIVAAVKEPEEKISINTLPIPSELIDVCS